METNKNFAVIGLGEFGSRICEVLVEEVLQWLPSIMIFKPSKE